MKKFLLFILIFIPALAMADETRKCGDNVTYWYDSSSQTLYISGQGRMYDYAHDTTGKGGPIGFDVNTDNGHVTRGSSTDSGTKPWGGYKEKIKNLVICEGVTYVGEYTFNGLQNLESVVFPSSLTELGHTSFYDCSSLQNIYCYATRVPEHARDGLDTSSKDCKLYVPASSVDLYKQYFDSIFQKNGSKFFRYIASLQNGDPKPKENEAVTLSDYVGYVLCYDHQVMSLEDYKAQLNAPYFVRAEGVIFSTANQDHKTLAVMLFENPGVQFTNYMPLYCGTSCSADAFDGYQNSVSLKNTYEEVKFKVDEPDPSNPSKTVQNEYTEVHCSPLGRWVDDSHQYGQSDYIPSRAECRLLFAAVSSVNATIRALGGEEISVNPEDGGDCWYWTSTEDEVDAPNRAWLCSMKTGSFQQTPKTERHRARAIVALDNFYVSNIASPKQDRKESKVYYSLSGQRVTNPKPGIYIQGGRKVVIK